MWMWWGPGGVQETGSITSNKMGGEWRKDVLSQECMDKLLLLLHDCGQRTPLDSLP